MKINNATYVVSNADADKCPDTGVPEYAFIGRSNVGKSSLINMLTGRKGLAKTSQKPGKTLLINHFSINNGKWNIVDLPGYGYAARSKEQRDRLRNIIDKYILTRRQMTLLFVLIDSRHEPQKIDLEFIHWLGEHEVPFALVFTKADKLGPVALQRNISAYKERLRQTWEELPPIFATSSEKGTGRDELLGFIADINNSIEAECAASGVNAEEEEES